MKKQNRILDFYIQRERSAVKMIFGIPLFWFGFLFLVTGSFKKLLILLFVGIVGSWILHCICGSYISIACSYTGKELRKYGKLKEVKKDVEEQAKQALYCSGDQAITEKYLILLSSVLKQSRFGREKERLCLISTRELKQILITDCLDGGSGEKKGYTMRFLTWQNENFYLTVWETYENVCQIQKKLETCRDLGIGPARSQKQVKEDKGRLFPKETVFNPKKGVIQECYRKKRRFCIIVYSGVLGIYLIIIALIMWIKWDSFQYLFQSAYWSWTEVGLAAGGYLIPVCMVWIYLYWMERKVLRQYHRLKYYEQQEIEKQIIEAAKEKNRWIVCGKRCFWFRDYRYFGQHNLIFYEDVVWIYPFVRKISIPTSTQNINSSVWMTEYGMEFYTSDKKKHRVSVTNGKDFLEYFPDAIKGYGKKQKKEFFSQTGRQMRNP